MYSCPVEETWLSYCPLCSFCLICFPQTERQMSEFDAKTIPSCFSLKILVLVCSQLSLLEFRMYPLMKDEIRKVVTKGKAAGVLRLVFHDAGTFELDDNTGRVVLP